MSRDAWVTDWISNVGFSFYSEDELLDMSVKAVQLPFLFDNLDQPVPGGLYDPAMGPVLRGQLCTTCNQTEDFCPGHVGHIPLVLPTYHPLLFSTMFKLLRGKCMHCHTLRLRRIDARYLTLKLKLIRLGFTKEASDLVIADFVFGTPAAAKGKKKAGGKKAGDKKKKQKPQPGAASNPMARRNSSSSGSEADDDSGMDASDDDSGSGSDSAARGRRGGDSSDSGMELGPSDDSGMELGPSDDSGMEDYGSENDEDEEEEEPEDEKTGADKLARAESKLDLIEKQLRAGTLRGDNKPPSTTAFDYQLHRQVVKEVYSAFSSSKCPNCNCFSPRVKHEHQLKILLLPLLNARVVANRSNGALTPTAFHPKQDAQQEEATGPLLLLPTMVERHVEAVWKRELPLLTELCCSMVGWKLGMSIPDVDWRMFFLRNICVPPNRFRPPIKFGAKTFEHTHNVQYRTIVQFNADIVDLHRQHRQLLAETAGEQKQDGNADDDDEDAADGAIDRGSMLQGELAGKWMELQRAINQLMDNKDPNGEGIVQLFEKKTGLFRQNMMGKRVNYAARSVISPDVFLEANEVGVPIEFAQELTFPESVNQQNVERLRQAVINGPQTYPGANFIVDETGRKIDLGRRSEVQRQALAKSLLADELYGSEYSMQQRATQGATGQRKTVFRHLVNGDHVLMNRQPSLHKPSILAHKARVLRGQHTLRMHYANCKSYNADFDGDEMNMHLPQDFLSQSEARYIAVAHNQFCGPADGNPLRGLIQDHIVGGVMLSKRDTFFTRGDFLQLLYATCHHDTESTVELPMPAVIKPRPLWTGKQLVSALVKFVCRGHVDINLTSRAQVNRSLWRGTPEESEIIVRNSELLQGVIDKKQLGASSGGICHAVSVLCGNQVADALLSAFGRLVTHFVREHGHTCGVGDMLVTPGVDSGRSRMLRECEGQSWQVSSQLLDGFEAAEAGLIPGDPDAPVRQRDRETVRTELQKALKNSEPRAQEWDQKMMAQVNEVTSQIIEHILPRGQVIPFPYNMMSLMTNTGAKGSNVNFSQIACLLGQQALEGRRVPVMASGKTLPCFQPYEGSARAGGFVGDRFLTGIRPAEYFFHCMAGREGLIDTAVKTARSGYLQRCLVKHLESLVVAYDGTVRSEDGGVVQFYYGEDGVDVVPGAYLYNLPLLANNYNALLGKLNVVEPIRKLDPGAAERFWQRQARSGKAGKQQKPAEADIMTELRPWLHLGCVSDRFSHTLRNFIEQDPLDVFTKPAGAVAGSSSSGAVSSTSAVAAPAAAADSGREALLSKKEKLERWMTKHQVAFGSVQSALRKLHKASSSAAGAVDSKQRKKQKKYADELETFAAGLEGKEQKKFRQWWTVVEQLLKQDAPSKSQAQAVIASSSSSSSSGAMTAAEFMAEKRAPHLLSPDKFSMLMSVLYSRSQVHPGESVGVLAAQSVGEPSTQMTLNTFHLAGHGGANVTLGVPRLREIIMTAAISSPIMEIPLVAEAVANKALQRQVGAHLAQRLNRLPLKNALATVQLREDLSVQFRTYHVRLNLRSGPGSLFQSADLLQTLRGGKAQQAQAHKALRLAVQKIRSLQRCVERTFATRLDRTTHARLWRYGIKKGKAPVDLAAVAPQEPVIRAGKAAPEGRRRAAREDEDGAHAEDAGSAAENEDEPAQRRRGRAGEDDEASDDDDGDNEDEDRERGSDQEPEEDEDGVSAAEESAAGEDDEDEDDSDSDTPIATGRAQRKQQQAQLKTAAKVSKKAPAAASSSSSSPLAPLFAPELLDSELEALAEATGKLKPWAEGGALWQLWTDRNERLRALGVGGSLGFVHNITYGVSSKGVFYVDLDVKLDSAYPKLLMMGLVEKTLAETFVQQTPGIKRAVPLAWTHATSESAGLVEKARAAQTHVVVQTEGVNLHAAWSLAVSSQLNCANLVPVEGKLPTSADVDLLDVDRIFTNDINAILHTYGVEAARQAIVVQIQGVFEPYGISVDPRHLGLIADYATYMGGYRAFNRMGMQENASPFQKISFETAKKFLSEAAFAGNVDYITSPSASIAIGQPPKSGTGTFDLLNELPARVQI